MDAGGDGGGGEGEGEGEARFWERRVQLERTWVGCRDERPARVSPHMSGKILLSTRCYRRSRARKFIHAHFEAG